MGHLIADRSERGKLRAKGPQDAWFLHQILTQDFEGMPVGESRDAAQITAHGRMVGYLEFLRTEEGFLAHFEPSLQGSAYPDQIARYVFATQVEVEDITEEFGLLLLVGEGWEEKAAAAVPGAPLHPSRGVGTDAGYLWVPASEVAAAYRSLVSAGAEEATEQRLEEIRIANGAPRWGKEMNERSLPQESGIDQWAIHYDKGCYVGQEAMAKIHFRGKVNRRLARLEGSGLVEGADVTFEGQKVGAVTSSADGMALAVVRSTVEPGAVVEVKGTEAKVVA
jgi:folate-binding protein YgfZ